MAAPNQMPRFEPDLPPELVEKTIAEIEEWCQEHGSDWSGYLHNYLAHIEELWELAFSVTFYSSESGLDTEPHAQHLREVLGRGADAPITEEDKRLIANEVVHTQSIIHSE